jgi:hypothetical protein
LRDSQDLYLARQANFATIRALANDVPARILTDERLETFVDEAEKKVALIAASLFALSVGNYEMSKNLMAMAGLVLQKKNEEDMLKKEPVCAE